MQKQDRIFDGWAERFEKRIYADNNPKGLIRQSILERDLRESVLDIAVSPLDIIDVGGGLGQMASWLSQQGHKVTLAEPSADMLERARAHIDGRGNSSIRFLQTTLQELPDDFTGSFDLVICHAVLEWLAQPRDAIGLLSKLMRRGGTLSLMFYNRHSALMRSLVVGDFERVSKHDLAGDGIKRLAPISPLEPDEVASWVSTENLDIHLWSGVRTFYDYMLPDVRLRADIQDVIKTEANLSRQMPWRHMARYQHMICKSST